MFTRVLCVEEPVIMSNKTYLLIENPSKGNNLGPIIRCAAAFAVHQLIFIGYEKCGTDGSHGASRHVDIVAFPTFSQAEVYLKGQCHVTQIIGILGDLPLPRDLQDEPCPVELETVVANDVSFLAARIMPPSTSTKVRIGGANATQSSFPKSLPIHQRPFSKVGNVCFSISKRRFGLPASQAEMCTSFVHVPTMQIPMPMETLASNDNDGIADASSNSKPSIQCGFVDSQTCLSIALHHYTAASGYKERDFDRQKFQVATVVKGGTGGDEKRLQREQNRLERAEEGMEDDNWILFDEHSDY